MKSPFMLHSGWYEPGLGEYLAPNLVAEAAKDFGVTDDRARLAIARAGVVQGRKVARWEESAAIAAEATGLDAAALLAAARSPAVEERARALDQGVLLFSSQSNGRPSCWRAPLGTGR